MIHLFNTLSGKIDEVKAQDPPEVKVYTCGPTVYDHSHVGHWYNYIRMDLLIRVLKANGLKPKWVMNITDVGHLTSDADEGEDKLETGAKREGKTAWEIAEFYTKEFVDGMEMLNILKPDYLPKATDHIAEQIELIKKLEEKGFTYNIDDGIYYDTAKFPSYKDFARLDLDEQQSSDRVSPNPQKRQPQDFALWKFSPLDHKRDMEWDSPWGKGFPGWHIECSAMCHKYLGDTLDIHAGGIDHIPVHHTNEIAQSEAVTGKPLANIWLHSNHVLVNGQKISKSFNNGITLNEVSDKGFNLESLRVNVLESSYRSQSHFSWDSLQAAANRLNDYKAMAILRYQAKDSQASVDFDEAYKTLLDTISNDLNSPQALAYLSELCKKLLASGIPQDSVEALIAFLRKVDDTLGLELSAVPDIDQEAKDIISAREEARKNQNWEEADKLRAQLQNKNILINDEQNGIRWQWLS